MRDEPPASDPESHNAIEPAAAETTGRDSGIVTATSDPIRELETRAKHALEGGRAEEAGEIVERLLHLEPHHLFALKASANIARSRGDFATAMARCEQAIAAHSDDVWLYFDKAQILRDQALFDEACALYHQILVRRPHFLNAYLGLGQVARLRGRWAESLTFFRLALDQSPSDERRRLDVAESLRALGQYDEAVAILVALNADRPDFFQAERTLGLILQARGDHENAIRLFRSVYQKNPSDLWNLNDLARILHAIGRTEEAKIYYDVIIAANENFVPALIALCGIYLDLSDTDSAMALLARAQSLNPDDSQNLFNLSLIWIRLGGIDEAVEIHRRLASGAMRTPALDARFVGALRKRAFHERTTGNFAGAVAAWRAILDITPDDRAGLLELARDLAATGDVEGACGCYRRLLGDRELAMTAAVELVQCALRFGAWGLAPDGVAKALEIHPNDPSLLFWQAVYCRQTGRYERADAFIAAALAVGADLYGVLIEKAHLARARNDGKAVETLLGRAIGSAPDRPAAYCELAKFLGGQGRYDEARAMLRRLLDAAPGHSDAMFLLGELELRAGDLPRAREIFQEMLAGEPDHLEALISLASVSQAQGRAKEAGGFLARARTVAPDDIRVVEGGAKLALESGDLERALAGYRDAVRIDPSRLWPRVVVARLTALIEDEDEGIARFRALLGKFGRQPDLCFAFVDLLQQVGRFDEATAAADDAVATHPGHAGLWTQAALLRLARGDFPRVEEMPAGPPADMETEPVAARLALSRFDHDRAARLLSQALAKHPDDQANLALLAHLRLLAFDLPGAAAKLKRFGEVSGRRASTTHLGNLHNEFGLEPGLAQRAKQALSLAPEARLDALRAIVVEGPDYTPASLALLIESRRQGFPAPPLAPCPIPRVVMQFSEQPFPGFAPWLGASWRAGEAGYEVRGFNRQSAGAMIRASGRSDLVSAFQSAAEPAIRADLFRLFVLHSRGGVFLDSGARPQREFSSLFERGSEIILLQDEFGAVGAGMIASVPRHWLVERALNEAVAAVNDGAHDMAWLCSGAGLMSRALATAVAARGAGWRDFFSKLDVVAPDRRGPALALDCWVRPAAE